MTLTLSIRNVDRLDNGMPTEFVLHRRGATIGRSPTCDWSLPDPRSYISSKHCEISFTDEGYVLSDISTNGTLLNGSPERMPQPHRIQGGDVFTIGQYEVVASLSGSAAMPAGGGQDSASEPPAWTGWDSQASAAPSAPAAAGSDWGPAPSSSGSYGGSSAGSSAGWAPPVAPSLARPDAHRVGGFGAPPSQPSGAASLGGGGGWAPSHRAPDLPVASTWEAQIAPPAPASEWSSAAPDRPPVASPDDVWGKISEGNVVDWARGGFGRPEEVNSDPLGLNKPDAQAALPKAQPQMTNNLGWGPSPAPAAPPPEPTAPPPRARAPQAPAAHASAAHAPAAPQRPAPHSVAPPSPTAVPGAAGAEQLASAFFTAAGIGRSDVSLPPAEALSRAGSLLKRLVAGLVVMVEARARAKSQMGAEATSLSFEGNNPIKFARTPEQALAQLLNPPQRGFMEAERAIEDAYYDLQSHQMATLKAMQGALKSTLARFSPMAIKQRAESKGVLARIIPGARDAALWQNYEREFSGVAQGSDEAFMDVFAKEFRKAYEEQSRQRR